MKLTAPKNGAWGVATALGVIGLIGHLATIPFVTANAFWFVFVGFAILAVACLLKGV